MKFGKIKNIIGAVAPTLGAALGGPVGGAAAKIIAEVLGCKADPNSITAAFGQASPEILAKMKKAELDFEAKMKEMEVDIFALETADKQDARSYFAKDWTPRIIAMASLMGFLGYIFMVTIQPPDQNSDAIINLVLGYLGGTVSAIISFYFGASNTQDKKD